MSWVLLRGLTREARHWGDLPQQLAGQLPPLPDGSLRQVTTLDLPGNGEFFAIDSPPSVRAMTESARSALLVRGCKPPYGLVAMSLGGMVAADWAQRHPREIAALVLINTSMRPFSRATQRLRPHAWSALALLAARWANAAHAERVIHQLTCNNTVDREKDLAAWTQIRTSAPVSAGNAVRQLRAAAAFSAGADKPACPTLVLSSAADRLVHPVCSARLANAWQATHQQHPWAGHDLPHDDPAWVCRQIAAWAAGHPPLLYF